ncbi:MAG TPA: class I SAM-dependent methyltransferase [Acidimicrobiia bacterium]|nr:class I SAM-dependent methyltransferase [Acidimicrobiia bacterium]
MAATRLARTLPSDEAALTYDRWFETRWGRYAFEVEARSVIGELGTPTPGLVLDAGCGTGRLGELLEAHGAAVVGVDIDPGMLVVASQRLAGPRVLADLHRLPFRDGAFAASVAVTVLCFAGDPTSVLSEVARVTRPGGRLVVGELNPRSPWGLGYRRRFREPPWRGARFLTRRRLLGLGARPGRARVRGALFAPRAIPGLSRLGPLLETAGRLAPGLGAFQVLVVERV